MARENKRKNIILFTFIFIIVIFLTSYFIFYKISQRTLPTPSPTIDVSSSPLLTSWKTYVSTHPIDDLHISLLLPPGWRSNWAYQEKQPSSLFRITFDFAPPGWNMPTMVSSPSSWIGWGMITIDIYKAQADITTWLQTFYPTTKSELIISPAIIGNKKSYYLSARPGNDWQSSWIPRTVVLGNHYSYVISYSQNGEPGFIRRIETELFPRFYFY